MRRPPAAAPTKGAARFSAPRPLCRCDQRQPAGAAADATGVAVAAAGAAGAGAGGSNYRFFEGFTRWAHNKSAIKRTNKAQLMHIS